MGLSILEKSLLGVSFVVPSIELLFYRNSVPHTPAERIFGTMGPLIDNPSITPYIGNFPESFGFIALSGFVGDLVEETGMKYKNKLLQNGGLYLPELTAFGITVYGALGETILPFDGTPDILDIPAVLISAFCGYMVAKFSRKSDFNNSIRRSFNNINSIGENEN